MAPEKKQNDGDSLQDALRKKMEGSLSPGPAQKSGKPTEKAAPGGGASHASKVEFSFGGPSLAQMTAFCRQLSILVAVGIPLVRALRTLSERIKHPQLRRVVSDVARRVEEGETFSDALSAHPRLFSRLIVNVVRIGEEGGILEDSLRYLADLMERRNELRMKVAAAMAYPISALIVCGLVLLVVLGFAIPVFEEVYKDMNVKLPAVTRYVLGLSHFTSSFWWLIILAVVGAVFGLRTSVRANQGLRRLWDTLVLRAPIVGKIGVKVSVARTSRTLANLLKAGIPLLEALSITAETSENSVVGDMFYRTHDNLEKGGELAAPMRETALYPDLVVDMIAIGDEAGRLDLMFDKIAETYDGEVNMSIKMLNAIIEPAMIIVMGGIVLTIALAVLLPYWKIMDVVFADSSNGQ
jgi:type II secretory pathway component PulF